MDLSRSWLKTVLLSLFLGHVGSVRSKCLLRDYQTKREPDTHKTLKSGFNQHQVTGDFICLNIEHVFAWFHGGPEFLDILNILSVK